MTHRVGAKVGLCGQAPSDHPEFAEFLVACGIDSMSISPDSFIAVKQRFPPYIVSGGRPVTRLRLITLIATGARRARLRSTSIDNYCPIHFGSLSVI
ncbi:MAG: putative PEP-binding protein, partial [Xanthobacteraceae bacterium]